MPKLIRYQSQAITCKKQVRQPILSWLTPLPMDKYIRTGLSTGMKLTDFAPRLSFSAIGMNHFVEIAKMRR
jgi:hypothetical protein